MFIVDKMRELGITGLHIKDFGGAGMTPIEGGAMIYEMAKIDSSVSAFYLVHNAIGVGVIDLLGSEE